jgi:hypothetical protein
MIKTSITVTMIVGLLSLVGSASAVERKQPGAGTVPSRTGTAPLTEGECTGLGGKSISTDASFCASGKVCVTTDKDGVVHHACINAEKH